MKFRILAAATASLALAACGSADDASTEAEADTVEVAADEALEPVTEEPVEDTAANEPAEVDNSAAEAAESASIEAAGDNAAATAEAALDAMAEENQ